MKKIISLVLIIFICFLWLNDYTPNEGIGEIKENVKEAVEDLKKEID